ncbi:MAG TPA: cupredoxin family copper-binding protein [Candidatus Acidoferrum sp.]|nr:cupredoxin family copper-binding protein [Candidatus Acidoferrum sp.]
MKKYLITLLIIIVAMTCILVAGCATNTNVTTSPNPTITSTEATRSSTSSSNATYTVTIRNFTFQPSSLTIKRGTTVTWVNEDSVAHTVTSDDGRFPSSGNLNKAETYQFQFNSPGSFDYHCSPHPFMKAKINVEA